MARLRAQLCLALLTLCSGGGRAQAQPLSITWQALGDPQCTKPEQVERQVLQLAQARAEPAHFEVRCEALSEGRQRCAVRLGTSQAQSERMLTNCSEAREAAILIMAMALAPEASPAPHAAKTAAAPSPAVVSPTRSTHWLLWLAGLVDYGTLPDVNAGPSLGVAFAARQARLGLSLRYLPPRSVPNLPPDVEAEISWFAATLSPAWVWRIGAWGLGPRLELELGAQRGRARGVAQSDPANALWLAGAAGAELEVWLHPRIGLQLVAAVGAPVRRPRFGFADDAPFYTATPYFVRGMVGLAFRLDAKE